MIEIDEPLLMLYDTTIRAVQPNFFTAQVPVWVPYRILDYSTDTGSCCRVGQNTHL